MAGVESVEENLDEKDERIPVKFTQTRRLVCIEYPGFVKDISKVLKTLGGEQNVDSILKDPLRRVGLRFRPNDPYSKQAFGDRFPVNDVLMKVKRRTRKKRGNGEENEEVQYECEILGVIDTVVKFKGLADFQYLAPDVPDLLKELHGSEILEIDTPLHIPPLVFARVDHPHAEQFRAEPQSKDRNKATTDDRCVGTYGRKRRLNHALSCGFNSPAVPSKPKEEALKEMSRYDNDGLDVIQRLFNTRPLWSRRAVVCHLGKSAVRVKNLLPCVAYYWVGGPWRAMWTKFGYDPRRNPAAKIYQMLDFRLRAKKALRGMKLPPTIRSIYDFSLHTGVQRTRSNTVRPTGIEGGHEASNRRSEDEPGTANDGEVEEEQEVNFEAPEILPYVFYPDRPPPTRQVIYQLCDIHIAEVQKILSANDGKETECTLTDGWLKPGTSEKIRKAMTDSLVALCEKQKVEGEQVASESTTQGTGAEQLPGIEDEEATFLDTLMDDDDVEAYDILDDEF